MGFRIMSLGVVLLLALLVSPLGAKTPVLTHIGVTPSNQVTLINDVNTDYEWRRVRQDTSGDTSAFSVPVGAVLVITDVCCYVEQGDPGSTWMFTIRICNPTEHEPCATLHQAVVRPDARGFGVVNEPLTSGFIVPYGAHFDYNATAWGQVGTGYDGVKLQGYLLYPVTRFTLPLPVE